MMKDDTTAIWRVAVMTIIAATTPFGAWAMGQATLKATIITAILAAATALHNWLAPPPNMPPPNPPSA